MGDKNIPLDKRPKAKAVVLWGKTYTTDYHNSVHQRALSKAITEVMQETDETYMEIAERIDAEPQHITFGYIGPDDQFYTDDQYRTKYNVKP